MYISKTIKKTVTTVIESKTKASKPYQASSVTNKAPTSLKFWETKDLEESLCFPCMSSGYCKDLAVGFGKDLGMDQGCAVGLAPTDCC